MKKQKIKSINSMQTENKNSENIKTPLKPPIKKLKVKNENHKKKEIARKTESVS